MGDAVPLGVVIPVRNEAPFLPRLLESLARQSGLDTVRRIVVVDGRSEDTSVSISRSWQDRLPMLRVIENPERLTSIGFNIGARECLESGCEAVLFLGAHGGLEPEFFQRLQGELRKGEYAIIGAVHVYPEPACHFDRAIQAFAESEFGRRLGWLSQLTVPTETTVGYCPTIRREVFAKIGLFDPSMVRNQDNDFESRARAAGFRVVTDPSLRYLYVPPGSLAKHWRQMYGNGYWVGRRFAVHGAKHFAPATFWIVLIGAGALGAWVGGAWTWVAVLWLLAYLGVTLAVSLSWWPRIGRGALYLPWVLLTGHAAYAWGTFGGAAASLRPTLAGSLQ